MDKLSKPGNIKPTGKITPTFNASVTPIPKHNYFGKKAGIHNVP
jgi:hypothetical protein